MKKEVDTITLTGFRVEDAAKEIRRLGFTRAASIEEVREFLSKKEANEILTSRYWGLYSIKSKRGDKWSYFASMSGNTIVINSGPIDYKILTEDDYIVVVREIHEKVPV